MRVTELLQYYPEEFHDIVGDLPWGTLALMIDGELNLTDTISEPFLKACEQHDAEDEEAGYAEEARLDAKARAEDMRDVYREGLEDYYDS